MQKFPSEQFEDVLLANTEFQKNFEHQALTGSAIKGLAVVTCMDSRIDPLAVVGMKPGDVKILRNAGARVTSDVLRTLVLATLLLQVNRILVMPHTDCAMAMSEENEIHKKIYEQHHIDTRSLEFQTVTDQKAALKTDLIRIRSFPLLLNSVTVAGAIYNVESGALELVDG